MREIIKKYNYVVIFATILIPVIMIMLNILFQIKHIWMMEKFFFFYIFICILAIPIYFKTILNFPKRILIPLIIFLEVAFISSVTSVTPHLSIFGLGTSCVAGYVGYLAFFGVFVSAATLDEKIIKFLVKVMVIISAILAILSISKSDLTYYLFNFSKDTQYLHIATFYQINHYGYYLLITSLCSLYLFLREKPISSIFYLFTTLILVYMLILNNTCSAFLAFAFAFLVIFIYCIKKKKLKRISILILIFVVAGLFFAKDIVDIVKTNTSEMINDVGLIFNKGESNIDKIGTGRGQLWKAGVEYWLEKPWTGYGVDNIRYKYIYDNILVDKPHNFILELLTTTGIIGCVSYLAMIFFIFISVLKKRRKKKCKDYIFFSLLVSVSYLISAFFGNSRLYTSPYFYIALGFCFKCMIDKRLKETNSNK